MSSGLIFWIVAAVLTAGTVAAIVRPLSRRHDTLAPSEAGRRATTAVFRDQLDEIARDLERGVIDADTAEAARTEVSRRLIATAEGIGPPPGAMAAGRVERRVAVALAIVVPLSALALYLPFGWPEEPARPLATRDILAEATSEERVVLIRGMVEGLAARLETEPDDLEGWRRLARSWAILDEAELALSAAGQAARLAPDDPEVLGEWVAALLGAGPRATLPDGFGAAMERLATIRPEDGRALWFAGMAALERGDVEATRQWWTALSQMLLPGSAERRAVELRIEALPAVQD